MLCWWAVRLPLVGVVMEMPTGKAGCGWVSHTRKHRFKVIRKIYQHSLAGYISCQIKSFVNLHDFAQHNKNRSTRWRWHIPLISMLRRQRWADLCKFEDSLSTNWVQDSQSENTETLSRKTQKENKERKEKRMGPPLGQSPPGNVRFSAEVASSFYLIKAWSEKSTGPRTGAWCQGEVNAAVFSLTRHPELAPRGESISFLQC